MNQIVNFPAVQIFIGTLPVTVLLALNLIEVKSLRSKVDVLDTRLSARMDSLNGRIDALAVKVGDLAERVAKIEGRIEGHHVVLEA